MKVGMLIVGLTLGKAGIFLYDGCRWHMQDVGRRVL